MESQFEEWFPVVDNCAAHRVVVLGAGVIGLSSALALSFSFPSLKISILSRLDPPSSPSASSVAAGFFFPYNCGGRIDNLAKESFEMLQMCIGRFAASHGETNLTTCIRDGLSNANVLPVMEIEALAVRKEPDWPFDEIPSFLKNRRRAEPHEIPNPHSGARAGMFYTSVIMQPQLYLPMMMDMLTKRGIQIIEATVTGMESLPATDIVINCLGVGAGIVSPGGDPDLHPLQGTVVLVDTDTVAHPWKGLMLESVEPDSGEEFAVIVPRGDYTLLGGTARPHRWETKVTDDEVQGVLSRCRVLLPALEHARVEGVLVGLRPGRSELRLGRRSNQQTWIDSYGYGGAGWTLHLGAAKELIREASHIIIQSEKCKM